MNAPLHQTALDASAPKLSPTIDSLPGIDSLPAIEPQLAIAPLPAMRPSPVGLHRPSGVHLLADFHGVAPELLTDPATIDALLRACALAAGARILHSHFHSFGETMGVTGVLLLAESHISIHTWPETGFAAADIFMCGDAAPQLALSVMTAALKPALKNINLIARGV